MLLRAIIVIQKMKISKRFSKFSSDKVTLCNNNDQTWFSDTLTSVESLGDVKTLAFQARVSAPSLDPADVSAYSKTCLIPRMTCGPGAMPFVGYM